MGKYILAHDLGTSGNKAVLFDEDGNILGSETAAYKTYNPRHGWYEQDPEELWRAVVDCTGRLLRGKDAGRVAAISFSDQMHGCICVDQKGTPLYPAMIWSDQRAADQLLWLEENIGARTIYDITAHRLNTGYTLEKLLWLRANHPEIFRGVHKVLHSKEYIIFKLTGVYATEPTDASGTHLYDLRRGGWSARIFDATGLDVDIMPPLVKTTDVVGTVSSRVAGDLGLPAGIPVVCGGGDGIMATVGAGCIRPGQTCVSMGTSAYASVTAPEPVYDPDMTTFTYAHAIDGWFVPCGAMSCCGLSYSWIKEIAGEMDVATARETGRNVYQLLDERVAACRPGAGGLLFLPYLAGERCPRWNNDARGAFIGLNLKHTKGEMLRSVLEGVAYNLDVILQVFRNHLDIRALTLIGGAAKGAVWSRIIADVTGLPVQKLTVTEYASSIGAAITAGVGTGLFRDFNVVERFLQVDKRIEPIAENVGTYQELKPLFNESYHSLTKVFAGLAEYQKSALEGRT